MAGKFLFCFGRQTILEILGQSISRFLNPVQLFQPFLTLQLTCSTGSPVSPKKLGSQLSPRVSRATSFHCSWVTANNLSQKPRLIVTTVSGPSSFQRPASTTSLPHLKTLRSRLELPRVDSQATLFYPACMSTTLTIPDLDEAVEQKLQALAVSHGRSLQAEAREILATAVKITQIVKPRIDPPRTPEEMRERLGTLTGIWEGKGSTEEMMRELRGED